MFVLERELSIIEKRAGDVDQEVYDEYVTFLRHLMSVSRRYQYGKLTAMQDAVVDGAAQAAGVDEAADHTQVEISFTCPAATSDLNLFINMTKLNKITITGMNLATEDGVQKIAMTLDGNLKEANMRRLLCQIGKEADDFRITAVK